MSTVRKKSPRAPSIALDEAIERTARVYDKERRHAAPVDVIAQNLGYKSANNGKALSMFASLRYYGLLERPKDGHLAVSKDFESYQFAPDTEFRQAIVQRWLRSPEIFSDLLEKYSEGLPSDATLKFDLIQRGFNPTAAEALIQVFKRSLDFAGGLKVVHLASDADQKIDSEEDSLGLHAGPDSSPPVSEGKEPLNALGVDRIPVRLSGGRRAWLLIPSPFYEADKKRLKAQIDLILAEDQDTE